MRRGGVEARTVPAECEDGLSLIRCGESDNHDGGVRGSDRRFVGDGEDVLGQIQHLDRARVLLDAR